MGYSTDFKGTLKFKNEIFGSQLALLNSILGEDCRDHPEWKEEARGLYYIQLKITDNFDGIEWDGCEKTGGMVEIVNLITLLMKKKYPDFEFTGSLSAQGERFDDRWTLIIEDGIAYKKNIKVEGDVVRCPHCDQEFELTQEKGE